MLPGKWKSGLRGLARVAGALLVVWALAAATGWSGALGWIAELGANFPALPVLAAAMAMGLLGWSVGRLAAGIGGVVLAGVIGLAFVPAPGLGKGSSGGKSLKFATWNAYLGNLDPAAALRWIDANEPDVIAFTEFTKPLHKALKDPLARRYPFSLGKPRNGPVGLMVFSKAPIANWSRSSRHQRWASFDLDWPGGRACRVIFVHSSPPTNGPAYAARAEILRTVAAEVQNSSSPVVVLGDWNATRASADFRAFCLTTGLVPATDYVGSWHANLPAVMRIGIDHVLAKPRDFEGVSAMAGSEGAGSDHLPVMAEIRLRSTSPVGVR